MTELGRMHGVPAVLEQRIINCVAWASEAVRSAACYPERWTPPQLPTEETELCRPFDKMLNEAALLALITHRAVGDHPAIAKLLENIARSDAALGRIYELIRWHPYLWTSLGAVWVVLDRFSLATPASESGCAVCGKSLRLFTRGNEHLTDCWTRLGCVASPAVTLIRYWNPRPCLAVDPSAGLEGGLFMSTSESYATHTPMYMTDFGRRGLLPAPSGWIGSLGLWLLAY